MMEELLRRLKEHPKVSFEMYYEPFADAMKIRLIYDHTTMESTLIDVGGTEDIEMFNKYLLYRFDKFLKRIKKDENKQK